jgi:phage terminase large subunit
MEHTKTKIQIPLEYKPLFDRRYRYFAIYGGRGSLKSHTVARRLILAAREKKSRILCTRELQKSIKDSVHKLLSDIINLYEFDDFTITKEGIFNNLTKSEFIFTGIRNNPNEIKSMEGIDFAWCEEAHSLTKDSINILTPTIRKPGSQIIFTYNRMNELDPIHKKFVIDEEPGTCVINVNYDIAIKYGWFPDVLKQEMEADKKDPILFAHKWLGEPIGQAEKSIIARDAVLLAMDRTVGDEGKTIVGADIARMGNDRTVFWKRKGLKTISHEIHSKLRTTEICDALEKFINFSKEVEVKVDDTGVGGGVTDEMIKRGYEVVAINFGAKAGDIDKYPNLISEAWFYMNDIMPECELPMHSDLLMELSTRQWKQDNKGRRTVESKGEYKKRGFRSPDIADACIICYYEPQGLLTSDDFFM